MQLIKGFGPGSKAAIDLVLDWDGEMVTKKLTFDSYKGFLSFIFPSLSIKYVTGCPETLVL